MKQFASTFLLGMLLTACAPTIKVAAPEKPLEINLNVKVDHEIRVKVDKEVNELLKENEEIF